MKMATKSLFLLYCLIGSLAYSVHGYAEKKPQFVQLARNSSGVEHATSDQPRSAQSAFANRQSNIQITGSGRVVRILADDVEGSRHQKFILKLASGQTLLIAHNIDLAPRINSLAIGDQVGFHGEYEWNAKGGIMHWTHHDPRGRHEDGWLLHDGTIYR